MKVLNNMLMKYGFYKKGEIIQPFQVIMDYIITIIYVI